jgi:hypothetical protein
MERKRIKGRFAAEDKTDKGGVVKNQATAPTAEQHQAAPPNRAKSLVGSLLDKWKQRSRSNAAQ